MALSAIASPFVGFGGAAKELIPGDHDPNIESQARKGFCFRTCTCCFFVTGKCSGWGIDDSHFTDDAYELERVPAEGREEEGAPAEGAAFAERGALTLQNMLLLEVFRKLRNNEI